MYIVVSEVARSHSSGPVEPERLVPARVRRSSWHLLRYSNFRCYFVGSLASNLGTWLQNTAQVLLAYQFTHSVFAVGVTACAQFVRIPLLSPWSAVLAGRFGTRSC
jgi:hypothetical protein